MSRPLVVGYCDGAHTMLEVLKPALQAAIGPDQTLLFRADPFDQPDLLVYSVFGQRHVKYTCPRILMCGEPWDLSKHRPQLVIDCKKVKALQPSQAPCVYLPFYVTSFGERFQNRPEDLIKTEQTLIPAHEKTKFCAFLYSQNVDFRNRLFDFISRYRPVDALGKARSTGRQSTDRQVYQVGRCTYNDLAVQKYRPYKFVICCENSRHEGYVTEKMISAMLAQAIPIYYGAPDVVAHFNPKSFIHLTSEAGWAEGLERIRRLDQNPEEYEAMRREPWLHDNQLGVWWQTSELVRAFSAILSSGTAHVGSFATAAESSESFRGLASHLHRVARVPRAPPVLQLPPPHRRPPLLRSRSLNAPRPRPRPPHPPLPRHLQSRRVNGRGRGLPPPPLRLAPPSKATPVESLGEGESSS